MILLLGLASDGLAAKGPYDWAFVRLDYARQEKVRQLKDFCQKMHALAQQAAHDKAVIDAFDINQRYMQIIADKEAPAALSATVQKLRDKFTTYYIENYFSFYDMLFIDRQGKVFYTIRKESDMNKNVFQSPQTSTPLAQCLAQKPAQEEFIDFHLYGPSAEPAAFFVEPIRKNGAHLGWIVLQCAINKANTIFAWTENLGQTGETFLVNDQGFMLTNSSFEGDSTVLKKHLDDRNIQAKFSEGRGHRTVIDYRDQTALTSFEVVTFLETRWLVVAKMDKSDIVTRHYARHRRYYADKLLANLKNHPPPPLRQPRSFDARNLLRVDMDEFLKAGKEECLFTQGVATCTGLLVAYPGKFAYLAHISPRDMIYGAERTNLLGQVIKKVGSFDIRPFEKNNLIFLVVANHLDSVLPIIDKLVQEGFLLSQLKIAYHPGAATAAVHYDYSRELLQVQWRQPQNDRLPKAHFFRDTRCVGRIIQKVVQAED